MLYGQGAKFLNVCKIREIVRGLQKNGLFTQNHGLSALSCNHNLLQKQINLPAPEIRSYNSRKKKPSMFKNYQDFKLQQRRNALIFYHVITDKFKPEQYFKYAPEKLIPYMYLSRMDKPTGTWLVYLPGAMSVCLAAPSQCLPSFYYLGLFAIGAFAVRGAGCIINDMWDRDVDKQVERTQNRPLANGTLTMNQAVGSLAMHLSTALAVLLTLDLNCILIGVGAMVPIILYPLAKRITYFPQIMLGLTINIGALMGYTAVTGMFNWQIILPLYMSTFFWTIYYDTIYAVQDMRDDMKAGVKSFAVIIAQRYLQFEGQLGLKDRLQMHKSANNLLKNVFIVLIGAQASCLTWLAWHDYTMQFPFMLAVILNLGKQYSDILMWSQDGDAGKAFRNAKHSGFILLFGIIIGKYLHGRQEQKERTKLTL